jgi:hypothetical protein
MLFYGESYDHALCCNGKSRAELPSLHETICLPLNQMEYGNSLLRKRYFPGTEWAVLATLPRWRTPDQGMLFANWLPFAPFWKYPRPPSATLLVTTLLVAEESSLTEYAPAIAENVFPETTFREAAP